MRCLPFTHKYTQWEVIKHGPTFDYNIPYNTIRAGTYFIQRKQCVKCGKTVETRTESSVVSV